MSEPTEYMMTAENVFGRGTFGRQMARGMAEDDKTIPLTINWGKQIGTATVKYDKDRDEYYFLFVIDK